MRKLYYRLLVLLNISGRDLAVFLLALLLAFSIWLIHNLSLKYNAYLEVPVIAKCNLIGHSGVSSDHADVIARCRATGYNVINYGIRRRHKPVEVEFQPTVMNQMSDDVFYVTATDLQEYAHLFFEPGVTVEYFATDTLFFRFPVENYKRVPVYPVFSVSYQHQYTNDGPMTVSPDSITIYGEPHMLDNVSRVYTESFRYNHLSDDIRGEVRLEPVKGLRFSEEKVQYRLDVERFVEIKAELPIVAAGVPSDKLMTVFPSNAEVVLKCTFPLQFEPMETIRLRVYYQDYETSLSGKCMVRLEGLRPYVLDYEVTPSAVECIVEDLVK